jgi:hypothetical protein
MAPPAGSGQWASNRHATAPARGSSFVWEVAAPRSAVATDDTSNLRRLRVKVKGRPHLPNLDRWQDLIERGDYSGLRHVLTGLDIDWVEMREVSPMGGRLSQGERSKVLGLAL